MRQRFTNRYRFGEMPSYLPPLPIAAIWLIVVLMNAWYVGWVLYEMALVGPSQSDWQIFRWAGEVIRAGQSPYTVSLFRWSPVAAELLSVITLMPFWLWAILHVAALALLRDVRLVALVLLSAPFVQDVSFGNMVTFSFVAAVLAVRGSARATWIFFAIALLVPRPLYLPILVWILWQRPDWRIRFAVLLLVHTGGVVATGWGTEWVGRLLTSGDQIDFAFNLGPSRIVGYPWLLIGLPLAAWLTVKGRLGSASLLASPYWLPYYFMFPLMDIGPKAAGQSPHSGAAPEG